MTTRQNSTTQGFADSVFARVLIFLLIVTGILFWFPPFYQYLGSRSMEIAHLHNTFGLVLVIAGIVALFRRKKNLAPKQKSGPLVLVIKFFLLLLIVTGLGLTVSQIVPRKLLMVLIYLHGTSAVIFICCTMFVAYLRFTDNVPWQRPAEKKDELPDGLIYSPNVPSAITSTKPAGVTEFLDAFGDALKQQRFKLALHDALVFGNNSNIFSEGAFNSGKNKIAFNNYSPSDCMISIYHRYFTFSGWMQGWFALDAGLNDESLRNIALLFLGYKTFGAVTKPGENIELLCARFGQKLFEEIGFKPIVG